LTPLFHSYHHHYEIMVEETPERQFHVIYTPYAGSKPVVLQAYTAAADAEAAARRFPAYLQLAELKGYRLEDKYFVHSSGRSVHVSFAMDPRMTREKFRAILDT